MYKALTPLLDYSTKIALHDFSSAVSMKKLNTWNMMHILMLSKFLKQEDSLGTTPTGLLYWEYEHIYIRYK